MKPAAWLLALALLDPVVRLDHAVRDAVQHARQPWLDHPMHALTDAGKPPVVALGLVAVAFVDAAGGMTTLRGCLLVLIPVNLAVETLKRGLGRTRPDGDSRRSNSSFPSSHAANAMAIAWMLRRRWPRAGSVLLTIASLVAFSRMYLDRHYLSDVVAAALLGVGFSMLLTRRWPALDPARVRARPEATPASG